MSEKKPLPENTPRELPIDGVLDLHTFLPRDVKELVNTYLDECCARGILRVRIIHGKGIGTLREQVHKILSQREDIVRFRLDSETGSSWGATLVDLAP